MHHTLRQLKTGRNIWVGRLLEYIATNYDHECNQNRWSKEQDENPVDPPKLAKISVFKHQKHESMNASRVSRRGGSVNTAPPVTIVTEASLNESVYENADMVEIELSGSRNSITIEVV